MKMSNYEFKRLHPLSAWLTSLRILREMLLPLIVFIATTLFGRGSESPLFIWNIGIVGGFVIFVSIWGVLSWMRFKYTVIDGELKIHHGVLIRKKQYISHERIQTIDLTEGIWHRMLGLVKVQVETAGGSKPEAVLTAVTKDEARWIKRELIARGKAEDEVQRENREEKLQSSHSLSHLHLILYGATSGGIGVTIAFLIGGLSQLEQVIPGQGLYEYMFSLFHVKALVLLFVIVFVVAWIFGVLMTVLKFAHFTISRSEEGLHLSRGLLERKQLTISLERVQAIRVVEGVIRGPLGYVTIHVESAGYGTNQGDSTILFPLLPKSQFAVFLQKFIPQYARSASVELQKLPRKALPGYLLRAVLPITLVAAVVTAFAPVGYLSLGLIPVALLYGFWRFKSAGWQLQQEMLYFRMRGWALTTAYIPKGRMQWCEVRQSPFQLRSGLSSCLTAVASGRTFKLLGLNLDSGLKIISWFDRSKQNCEMTTLEDIT